MAVGVIVAEDPLLVREGIQHILEASPDVELLAVCADGRELAAALERERPDVVLTDIRMPPGQQTHGLDIANRLTDRPRTRAAPRATAQAAGARARGCWVSSSTSLRAPPSPRSRSSAAARSA